MLRRGVMIFTFVFLIYINYAYAGFCDLSGWIIHDDTGAVTYGGATIGGYRFDFSSESIADGVKRTFLRNDFSSATTSNVTSDYIKSVAENFIAANFQKFGLNSYSNSRILSATSSSVDIIFDTDILVNADTCEGVSKLNGDVIEHFDVYGNLLGLDIRFFLTFDSSKPTGSAVNFTNFYYPSGGIGGGAGAGGGGGGAPGAKVAVDGNPQTLNPPQTNYQNPFGENIKDNQKFYRQNYFIIGLPIFLITIFLSILLFLISSRSKKRT